MQHTARVALDEEARDEVAEDRAIRRIAETAERLRREVEEVYGGRVGFADLRDAGDRARYLGQETLGLLGSLVQDDAFEVSMVAAEAIVEAAWNAGGPVVTVPHVEDAERIAVVRWGQIQALQDACGYLLRGAEEGETREARLDVLQELSDLGRVIPALARIQELVTLSALTPLLEHRNWPSLALAAEAEEEYLGYRVPVDPPSEVGMAYLVLGGVLRGNLPDLLSREDFRERFGNVAVRAKLTATDDERPDPFGFLLAVNDPYVSQSAIDRAVRVARVELQRQTERPKLGGDDWDFLELVAEVEDERGVAPDDRRPQGFWDVVRERWNEDHPDRMLGSSAVRTLFHRKGPTSKVRGLGVDR